MNNIIHVNFYNILFKYALPKFVKVILGNDVINNAMAEPVKNLHMSAVIDVHVIPSPNKIPMYDRM